MNDISTSQQKRWQIVRIVVCGLAGVICFTLHLTSPGQPEVLRLATVIFLTLAVFSGFKLHEANANSGSVPNFIREQVQAIPRDASGLSLAFDFRVVDNVCMLATHFQNRFAEACEAEISLVPGGWKGADTMTPIAFSLQVQGGEFGQMLVPVGVPAGLRGVEATFVANVSVRYPSGMGRRLLWHSGPELVAPRLSRWMFWLSLASLATGTVHAAHLAAANNVQLRWPESAAESPPENAAPTRTTIWLPEGLLP